MALLGGAGLVMVLTTSLGRLSANLPVYQASLSGLVDAVTQKLAARGIEVNEALKPNPARIMGMVGGLVGAALNLVGVALFAIVLIVLMLAELPLTKSDDSRPGSVRSGFDSAMLLVRRFVGLNGLFGAGIAVIDLIIMMAVGTDAAALWAVIAFLFAFVPFGFILSAIPPFITVARVRRDQGPDNVGLFFVVNFIGDNGQTAHGERARLSPRSSSWRASSGDPTTGSCSPRARCSPFRSP
jgi:predicted PurR-regulated permease PerM